MILSGFLIFKKSQLKKSGKTAVFKFDIDFYSFLIHQYVLSIILFLIIRFVIFIFLFLYHFIIKINLYC